MTCYEDLRELAREYERVGDSEAAVQAYMMADYLERRGRCKAEPIGALPRAELDTERVTVLDTVCVKCGNLTRGT